MTPAETQLLFGLIALQVGLITQAQLIVAFQAWTRDKSRLLADHLADGGAIGPDARAAVEAMVALHLRQHGGDAGRSLAAIPGEPSTLRRLAGLGDADLTASVTPTGRASATTPTELDPESTATFAFGDRPVDGQRYRILRHHASGGLGAVYVAHNSELGREVALKQILGRSADDPDSRQRFLLEAQVTGGLEHPGIVPVYGLGADADGRPYYAMRFIRGDSLKEAIERFHRDAGGTPDPADRALALRGLLRRFVDVCNAIEYAHGRGVLHRDIKPGNIILGTHGETLVVDWGLAKPVGRSEPGGPGDERTLRPSSASGSAETQPGSAIGTPAYMSPEQASGAIERLGPRSDVYSLGATLYCLIAGRAPFEGPVPAVLEKVRAGEFSLPRQVAPATDRALEAVCLKALARREEDRYPSARALADDVERWLADQPVTAMRDPLFTRAWRGIRRHRTAATTAAAVALVGLIALAVGNRQLSSANARTERWLDQAMASYEDYVSGFNEHAITGGRLPEDLVESLLAKPRQFYERLSAELAASASPTARERMMLARSRANLGRILSLLGRNAEARGEHEAAARLWEGLARDWPGEPEYHAGRAAAANSLAKIFQTTGQASEAEEAYARAVAAYEGLVRRQPGDDDHRDGLGWALSGRAEVLSAAGRNPEAIELLRRAIEVREGVVREHRDVPDYASGLAASYSSLGRILSTTGRSAEATPAFARSVAAYEALARLQPSSLNALDGLAWGYTSLGAQFEREGRFEAARATYSQAIDLRRRLVRDHPEMPALLDGLADACSNLGNTLTHLGAADEAVRLQREAVAHYEELVSTLPDRVDYLSGLGFATANLAAASIVHGEPGPAEGHYRRAIRHQRAAIDRQPGNLRALKFLGDHSAGLARLLRDQGRPEEAAEVIRAWVQLRPGDPGVLSRSACELALGLPSTPTGPDGEDPRRPLADEAIELLTRAVQSGWSDADAMARDPKLAPLRARADFTRLLESVQDRNFPADPFAR